jgi:hypothetical protein
MLSKKRALTRREPVDQPAEDSRQEKSPGMEKQLPGICPYCKEEFRATLPLRETTTYVERKFHMACLHDWRDGKPAPTKT